MIVVFGGAFNPPTRAHYEIAKHIDATDDVDEFLFMPVGEMYPKKELASASHRTNMLTLLCKKLTKAQVSDIEVTASKPMKTFETLVELKKRYPNQDIAFIMGADNLVDLPNWYRYEDLIRDFKIIVLNRDDMDVRDIIASKFTSFKQNFLVIDGAPRLNISSSAYRNDPKFECDVLQSVSAYVREHHLYGR